MDSTHWCLGGECEGGASHFTLAAFEVIPNALARGVVLAVGLHFSVTVLDIAFPLHVLKQSGTRVCVLEGASS